MIYSQLFVPIAGLPFHQVHAEQAVLGSALFSPSRLPQKDFYSGLADLVTGLMDGGERRNGASGSRDVVAADHGAIVRDAAAHDYRWSALILGVVESPAFLMRASQAASH